MKASLATSAALHALVLTWALVSLGSPESFDVADVEALPVDIVSIEELTQIQQGDKKAEVKEKAAPIPTKKETPVENAENAGDNEVDLKNMPTPEEKPRDIETAAAPEKAEKVVQTPDSKPVEDVKQEQPASEPSTEVAAVAETKQDVKPDPKPEATPGEEPLRLRLSRRPRYSLQTGKFERTALEKAVRRGTEHHPAFAEMPRRRRCGVRAASQSFMLPACSLGAFDDARAAMVASVWPAITSLARFSASIMTA